MILKRSRYHLVTQAWVIEKSNGSFANDYHYHYLMGNGPLDFIKI